MIRFSSQRLEFGKKYFPDCTPKIDIMSLSSSIRWTHITVCWKYESMEELFDLICLTKHLQAQGKIVSLYLPYIPNARMDRVKSVNEVFTLKHFCDVINSLEFEKVTVVDPHSDVSPALLNRVSILSNEDVLQFAVNSILEETGKTPYLFFPDAGAAKRYGSNATNGLVAGYANKNRDWATGEIKGLEICGDIPKDNPILIVDDICSYGGTFYHTSKKLKECGADQIYLCVTHCENSILKGKLLGDDGPIKRVFTTNSLFSETHPKISVREII